MSDGKLLDDALRALREACGMPPHTHIVPMLKKAAACVREVESLHKRLRGLAVDLGAVQTEDAVEDVRKVVEGMREVCEAAERQDSLAGPMNLRDPKMWDLNPYGEACIATEDAARRLAAARGEKP